MKFFQDLYREIPKITWPDRDMTIGHTIIVIVLCLVIGYYLGLLDGVFSKLLQAIITK